MPPNCKVHNELSNKGGWYYNPNRGTVHINYNAVLDEKWEKYEGENPSEW